MPLAGPVDIALSHCGIRVAETIHSRDFHMSPAVDPFHEIFHVVQGRISLVLGPEETWVQLPQGGYGMVTAGTRHQVVDEAASTVFLMCVSDDVIDKSAERRHVWNQLTSDQPWVATPQTRHEAETLHAHWRRLLGLQVQEPSPATMLRILTEFDESLLALYDLHQNGAAADAGTRVRLLIDEITARSSEHWSVGRAARKAGLSDRRFTQLFREVTGSTFVPWLQEQRIKRACRMLASGQHTIASAAFSSGFEDISHFYHVFQRLCGRTPRQWVLDNQENDAADAAPAKSTRDQERRASSPRGRSSRVGGEKRRR